MCLRWPSIRAVYGVVVGLGLGQDREHEMDDVRPLDTGRWRRWSSAAPCSVGSRQWTVSEHSRTHNGPVQLAPTNDPFLPFLVGIDAGQKDRNGDPGAKQPELPSGRWPHSAFRSPDGAARSARWTAWQRSVAPPGSMPSLPAPKSLICLVPLTAETRGLLGAPLFTKLPRGALLINVGRGGHFVPDDLLAALDSGQIGAAMLDVTEPEPLPPGHRFWRHPGIILTPHIASMTRPESSAAAVLDNIRRHRAGLPMIGAIDRRRGY